MHGQERLVKRLFENKKINIKILYKRQYYNNIFLKILSKFLKIFFEFYNIIYHYISTFLYFYNNKIELLDIPFFSALICSS